MISLTALSPPDRAQLFGLVALCVVLTLAVSLGAVSISPGQLLFAPLSRLGLTELSALTPAQEAVLWAIRLPRALLAVGVGGALGLAGALMQGLTRNPLADPGLLGVSSGAALGGAAATVLGGAWSQIGLPVAAIFGGLIAWAVVMAAARRDGAAPISTLLLCGVAVSALASSGTGLLLFIASDEQLRALTFWTLGSLSGASWSRACLVLGALAVGLGLTARAARSLNARLFVGADQRRVLPMSVVLGAGLLTVADLVARTCVAPAELPVGVLTALLGGPFFLYRLRAASPEV